MRPAQKAGACVRIDARDTGEPGVWEPFRIAVIEGRADFLLEQVVQGSGADYLERHGPHGWVTVAPGTWNTGIGFVQSTGFPAQQHALTRVAALSEAVHAARRNTIAIDAGNPDLYRHLEDALTWSYEPRPAATPTREKPGCHAATTTSTKRPNTSNKPRDCSTDHPVGAHSDAHDHDSPVHSLTRSRPKH
jgi:hypothetical protein